MRRLPRLDKPRVPMAGSFSPAVERWILGQQRLFDTSRSHVIVTAVSFVAGVAEDDYRTPKAVKMKRRGRLKMLRIA